RISTNRRSARNRSRLRMFLKLSVLVLLVAVAFAQRGTPPAPSECQICEHIIAQARHHFNNNVTNEKALQQELLNECKHLPPQEGASAEQTCIDMVNKNIDKIFSDIKAGDRDGQTCFDIGACTSIPTFQTRPYHTRPPTNLRAQRR
uniref:Saposin type B domain containing protein n=2 Tax=Haemonchus contortus TaxID=6289 RepID=A0A7I4Y1M9_HAECO